MFYVSSGSEAVETDSQRGGAAFACKRAGVSLGTTGLCFRARSGMSHGEGMGTRPEVRERTEGCSGMMGGSGGEEGVVVVGMEEGEGWGGRALKALFDLLHFVCLGCSLEQSGEFTYGSPLNLPYYSTL